MPGRSFDGLGGMVLGIVAPVMLGSILLLFTCRPLAGQVKLGASALMIVLVLYACEFYLARDVVDGDAREGERVPLQVVVQSGGRFDTRTDAEVVMNLRARGIHAVLPLGPGKLLRERADGTLRSAISIDGIEVLPLGGVANRVTPWCNESGRYTLYTSDSRGFRNPPHVWHLAGIEIAVIGNSFAKGACMPQGLSFVDRIRSVFPATLNLGMGRNGPLLGLATLKEYVRGVRPRIVLWVYEEENDLPHLRRERRSTLLLRYLDGDATQGLADRQAEVDRTLMDYGEQELQRRIRGAEHISDVSHLKERLRLRRVRGRLGLNVWRESKRGAVAASDLDFLREILRQARDVTKSWGGTFVFVYLPGKRRYVGDISPSGQARDQVLGLVADLEIPIIDAQLVFDAHRDPLSLFPFRHFVHYTERGHGLVARRILGCVSRRDFLRAWKACPAATATVTH